jgi:mevalonate kinase
MAAYGCSALAGANSFWSTGDYTFLSLMDACQRIIETLGVARIEAEDGIKSYEPAHLASVLSSVRGPGGDRLFGAKITGSGMGGDVLVFSKLEDGLQFEKALRRALSDAKETIRSRYPDFATVHFASSWLPEYPEGYRSEPAQAL